MRVVGLFFCVLSGAGILINSDIIWATFFLAATLWLIGAEVIEAIKESK